MKGGEDDKHPPVGLTPVLPGATIATPAASGTLMVEVEIDGHPGADRGRTLAGMGLDVLVLDRPHCAIPIP